MKFSDLEIKMAGCRSQSQLRRPEAGQFIAVLDVKDPASGETGRFYYELEWDKRDIMYEAVHTDNPALVCEDDDSPSCYAAFNCHQQNGGEEPTQGNCVIDAWISPYKPQDD